MKFLLLFFLATIINICSLKAQMYASNTDASGNTRYWRIINASETFANKCITDNGSDAKPFVIDNINLSDEKQKIELRPYSADTAKYYIRSTNTFKYFTNKYNYYNGFNMVATVTSRSSATPYTIIPIADNQVLIQCVGEDGIKYYLNASNENVLEEKVNLEEAYNSRYAWYIIDYNSDPTLIHPTLADHLLPNIQIQNRRIVIKETNGYDTYDLTGRKVSTENPLSPGVYLIHFHNGKTVKIGIN